LPVLPIAVTSFSSFFLAYSSLVAGERSALFAAAAKTAGAEVAGEQPLTPVALLVKVSSLLLLLPALSAVPTISDPPSPIPWHDRAKSMMSGRKNAGKASPCLLVLISIGCFFATYNFLTMVGHGRGRDGPRKLLYQDGAVSFASGSDPSKRFHVALTATDALYSQWQSRIMHYWYKEMRGRPGSDMGGFTRILHSGKPDGLMDEIPTLVVDPLPEGADRVRFSVPFCCQLLSSDELLLIRCFAQGYIVLNRPWAFVQWLQKADIKEE
jgi:hypothetical protein